MQRPSSRRPHCGRGYGTLFGVIVVSTAGLSVALALLVAGIGGSKTAVTEERAMAAAALADACAEEALQRMRDDTEWTGAGTVTYPEGDCDYSVALTGASEKTVETEGRSGASVRRLRILVDPFRPPLTVASWSVVGDL